VTRIALVAVMMILQGVARGQTTAPSTQPATGMKELAVDDGASAGKLSVAGGGHAIALQSPGEGYTLTGVRVYGSRYGTNQPPEEDFHLYVVAPDGKRVIADIPLPYKTFGRGEPRWVTLKAPSTPLPSKFFICLSFNPERTKGVYVHYDQKLDGDSRVGLPGAMAESAKGDWMIRAVVQPAGKPQEQPRQPTTR
jgi:hypothetical protein